jgi:hypothetical protein
MKIEQLIAQVKRAIDVSRKGTSKLTEEILKINGMISCESRHFLNALCSFENCRYLEIGCWQGASLISALYKNFNTYGVGVDNFSMFDNDKKNQKELMNNITKFLKGISISFIEQNCWLLDLSLFKQPFNVYFYDGQHNRKSQEMAFTHINPILNKNFVAIIDDWQSIDVQQGTKKAFDLLKYQIKFECTFPPKILNNNDHHQHIYVVEK